MKEIEEFFKALNKMGCEKEIAQALKDHLDKEHPTLAQNFFRVVYEASVHYAKRPYFDLRNEASGKLCKEIEKIDIYFPYV